MVALGILAYRKDIDLDLIRTLITIAANGDNNSLLHAAGRIPGETFNLGSGRTLALTDVSETVAANCHQDHPDPSWMEQRDEEEYYSWRARREKAFHAERQGQCETISNLIFRYSVPKQCAAFSESLMFPVQLLACSSCGVTYPHHSRVTRQFNRKLSHSEDPRPSDRSGKFVHTQTAQPSTIRTFR
jgi:hypothetical protein